MTIYQFAQSADTSTLVSLLRWRASHQSERHAFTFLPQGEAGALHYTYAELDQQARVIGSLLQRQGATGKPVLLLHPPGLEYIAGFFGCLYAGAIAVPAYPPNSARMMPRIQAIVADTQSSIVLTTTKVIADLQRYLTNVPALSSLEWIATDTLPVELADEWVEPDVTRDTLAFLQYTSGSTSAPRGVMVAHSNLIHNLNMLIRHCEQTPESHMVSWLPPYHDLGLVCGILYPCFVGYPSTLMSPVTFLQHPSRWLQTISDVRGTMSIAPNFAYDLCCRRITPEQRATLDLSSWELTANGGEPVRPATLRRFAETFGPCGYRPETNYPGYGMAEATLIIATNRKSFLPVIRTIKKTALEQGRAIPTYRGDFDVCEIVGYDLMAPDQKIRIVDPETLKQSEPEQVGEIWVSGPSIASGYWNNPQETERIFRAYMSDTGEGPFLRTGDLGFMLDNELFVTGRLKDLIVIQGNNHYPQDIEITVEGCHPAIRPGCSAAFSVDIAGKEQLIVLAEIDPRYQLIKSEEDLQAVSGTPRKPLMAQDVVSAVRKAIFDEHIIPVYRVMLLKAGGILKTSSGKLQRRACRDAFLAESLSAWDE